MFLSMEAFEALLEEVENQGGALLPEEHLPLDIEYTSPPYQKARKFRRATCGCGNQALFVSTYDPGEDTEGNGFIRTCAVCDNMGSWPRYREAVLEVDPDAEPDLEDDEDYDDYDYDPFGDD